MKTNLWRNRGFLWLIGGQTLSEFGSAISGFTIPWLLLELTGSALQMGLAFAVGFVPYLILSLPAGVWADRHNRKLLMMLSDTGRMILMLSIPVAHLFGWLTVAQLYIVLALMSAFSAVFDASYVSCLPNVVNRDELPQANSALQSGMSASQILGPAIAGTAIALIGAANTIFADAASFAISILSLFAIRQSFSAVADASIARSGMVKQIGEGLQYVWANKLIRTISMFTLAGNLGGSASGAIILYRLHHDLHANAYWSGVVMSGTSVGVLLGSLLSGVVGQRLKPGTIMMVSLLMFAIPDFVTAFTRLPLVMCAANVLLGLSMVLWNVQSVSLRQSVIPDHILGRASSSIRMIVWGSIPLGNAAGGVFAQWFGAPMVFVTAGLTHAVVWIAGWRTPLYKWGQDNGITRSASENVSG
jgi:MFS family permease